MSTIKNVKIISSTGKGKVELRSSSESWGELKTDLTESEVSFNGMSATIGETRNTLSMDSSALPKGDFTLFLTPNRTKSGAETADGLSYWVLRSTIQSILGKDDKAGYHFNKDRSYTNKSTVELRELLDDYYLSSNKKSVKSFVKEDIVTTTDVDILEKAIQFLFDVEKSLIDVIEELNDLKSNRDSSASSLTDKEEEDLEAIKNSLG